MSKRFFFLAILTALIAHVHAGEIVTTSVGVFEVEVRLSTYLDAEEAITSSPWSCLDGWFNGCSNVPIASEFASLVGESLGVYDLNALNPENSPYSGPPIGPMFFTGGYVEDQFGWVLAYYYRTDVDEVRRESWPIAKRCCSPPEFPFTFPIAVVQRILSPTVAIPETLRGDLECTSNDIAAVQAEPLTYGTSSDPFVEFSWYLDEAFVGSASPGNPLDLEIPLGLHTLKVVGTTASEVIDEAEVSLQVEDTLAPTIQASLVQGGKKNQLEVSIIASDICDPNPMFTSVAGVEVMDGQILKVDKKSGDLNIPSNDLSLTIIATDASGNTTEEQVQLQQ